MSIVAPLQPRWSPAALITCCVLAVLLLGSWLFAPSRELWTLADEQAFYLLNAPLAHSPAWAWVWAIGSVRITDLAVAVLMLALIIRGDLFFSASQVRLAFLMLLVSLVGLLLLRTGFNQVVKALDWQHAGPSLVLSEVVRMSELFPGWDEYGLKDASKRSFPGDHASVLMLWGLFLASVARWPGRLAILALVVVFMLPRLVAGAHWLSDNMVGGLFIALLSYALCLATPLAFNAASWLDAKLQPLVSFFSRWPIIGSWAVLKSAQS